ncbi:ATP-dependent DNA helicase sgs1 [Phlyctochytrium planicorne]|nr:ATP-dependent DNA helicase sgs1 [Phlyctochytrium planicorne]
MKLTVLANGVMTFGQTISYEIRPKGKNVVESIIALINQGYHGKSGIIYCNSKKNCEDVAAKLKTARISANHYHAGLDKLERRSIQDQWVKGITKVIVATVAFGMGIDKPDVRFVIHYAFPQSLEGYYQHDALIDHSDGNLEQKEAIIAETTSVQSCSADNKKITLNLLQDVFRGMNHKKIVSEMLNESEHFAKGSHLTKLEVERLCRYLISKNVLTEVSHSNASGFANSYVEIGKFARDLLNGRLQLNIDFEVEDKRVENSTKVAKKRQTSSKKSLKEDDIDENDSDDSETGRPRKGSAASNAASSSSAFFSNKSGKPRIKSMSLKK